MQRAAAVLGLLATAGLAACGPDYSPNTYASSAVQQANKVEQGVVVGVRPVEVSAAGVTGAATGAAAGGIAGSQTPGGGVGAAFGAIGGALIGGIAGSAVEHASGDTTAFEYIVRKPNGDLVSVTQKDKAALPLGQKVLVIAGSQARIVPDYTVPLEHVTPLTAAEAASAKPASTVTPVASETLPPPAASKAIGADSALPAPTVLAPVPPPPVLKPE